MEVRRDFFFRGSRRVSQQNGAKLQRAARVIFIPLLSCNQQSAITLILTDHAKNLSLCYQFLSLPLRRAGTHTFPGFFLPPSVSRAVFLPRGPSVIRSIGTCLL